MKTDVHLRDSGVNGFLCAVQNETYLATVATVEVIAHITCYDRNTRHTRYRRLWNRNSKQIRAREAEEICDDPNIPSHASSERKYWLQLACI
jgi:uncharacterized protein (UPF0147 family)